MLLNSGEIFGNCPFIHADVKRLFASDRVSAVGHCVHRQLHRTGCLIIPLTCWTIFVLVCTDRNSAVTS